jgi:hypothetical protein
MTVEIEYSLPRSRAASDWQVSMAKQIEQNRGFPIDEIERELSGTTLIVRVETSLPSQAVENMLSDIEDYLETGSEHVETREV